MPRTAKILRAAERDMRKMPRKDLGRVVDRIDGLEQDPLPHDVEPLHGVWQSWYRIRVGDYRIIYRFDDVAVYIARVMPRQDDYGGTPPVL